MLLWHTDNFELKALEKKQVQKSHSHPPFYPWNQEIKFLCEKCPACTRQKEDILITRERKSRPRQIYTNSVILTLTFLIPSSQCTAPNPNPFVLSILHKFIVCQKNVRAFCSGHLFGSSFSCEDIHIHIYTLKCNKNGKLLYHVLYQFYS